MKIITVSIMVILILAGTATAGEMIRLTCPGCGGLMDYEVTGLWD